MKIPEQVFVALAVEGRALEGVPAMLTFVMGRKNNHDMVFGPSDARGEIHISAVDIRNEARKNLEFFLMDYADIDTLWTGVLRVKPMNREALGQALAAFRTFRRYKYAPDYEGMLRRAEELLRRSPGAKLTVDVKTEPPGMFDIETFAVDA